MKNQESILELKSNYSVVITANKLESILIEKGLNVFARIDHSANANKVDLNLRPTQLILYGNPKLGTPLMLSSQSMAIDLPQKALIIEDENGDVFVKWNNPYYLKEKHNIKGQDALIEKIATALNSIMSAATS